MATWNSDNIILTKLGEQVLSKVQAGIGKLTVSRIVSGSGHVSPSQLYNQTQVTDIKQELIIDRYSTTNSSSSISTSLSNSGITEAYDLYQIGIYVTHPDFTDEVLYLIAQCDSPDHIPVPEDTPVTLSYELVMAHSGTDNVTINVTSAGTVSVDTFNQFADGVKSSLDKKASSENPVFTGEMHLTGDDSTTSVTIFTSENTVTIRNTDPNAENTTYTDLVITPDGIYKESVDNGVIIERTRINDGGNADTVGGRSTTGINSLVRYTCGNYDCNTTVSTGVYRGTFTNYPSNLPDGQGTLLVMNYHVANSEVSGTVGTDTTWLRQWFISPHGYSIYERLVVNTAVSAWTPINDGGNAATLESHPASDFALKTEIPTTLPANGGRSDTARHQIDHILGTGTDILEYAASDNCPSNVNTKVRIMHSPTCPTNYGYDAADNDFWYDIFKLDNSWITIKAYDVRGNVEFINSRINGKWSGWVRSADGGNANTANLAGSFSSTPTNVCLRNLSSGTADVTTTNCPRGAWYGKHS